MSVFHRLWDALGLGEPIDEVEYDEMYSQGDSAAVADWPDDRYNGSFDPREQPLASNVVGLPGRAAGQTEVLLVEPRSFEEMPPLVTALKQRKAVILNLSLMDADAAQRCVDFVAGGVFAIDGHQERVAETVFLFTPASMQINSHSPSELEEAIAPAIPSRRSAPLVPTRSVREPSVAE
jgi:cell division inhibitor SepF